LNSTDNEKNILTPHEIAILFGFPSEFKQKLSKGRDHTSPPIISVDHDQLVASDVTIMDLERKRTSILVSINFIERRIERTEDEKREHLRELESLSNLVPSFQSQREEYIKELIETDKSIHSNLGIEMENSERERFEVERPYPTLGVATIGFLMALIGSMIFYPFELPTTLQFVFGVGFLLIGLSVLISSILHSRIKSTRISRDETNPS
jgi:hypothetical protein